MISRTGWLYVQPREYATTYILHYLASPAHNQVAEAVNRGVARGRGRSFKWRFVRTLADVCRHL